MFNLLENKNKNNGMSFCQVIINQSLKNLNSNSVIILTYQEWKGQKPIFINTPNKNKTLLKKK